MNMKIEIYTDGSSLGNPGPGGWGSVLTTEVKGKLHCKTVSGFVPEEEWIGDEEAAIFNRNSKTKQAVEHDDGWYVQTTNNRMELQGIIWGLKAVKKKDAEVIVYADSKWAINALTGAWNVTENMDLVLEGRKVMEEFPNLIFKWVKGHSDNKWNEKANDIAILAVKERCGNVCTFEAAV